MTVDGICQQNTKSSYITCSNRCSVNVNSIVKNHHILNDFFYSIWFLKLEKLITKTDMRFIHEDLQHILLHLLDTSGISRIQDGVLNLLKLWVASDAPKTWMHWFSYECLEIQWCMSHVSNEDYFIVRNFDTMDKENINSIKVSDYEIALTRTYIL